MTNNKKCTANKTLNIAKSFISAFSMYSNIPMPQFEWKQEDMQYLFCFFPWVGLVVGAAVYLWEWFCNEAGIGMLCRVFISVVIPVFITGGIHVDGFMDTVDALHSYKPREEKLQILKDAHIGAFSVIMLAAYGLFYIGVFTEIRQEALLKIVCAGFVLSRCLCGISAVSFPLAKKEGMLWLFVSNSQKETVKLFLYLQLIICAGYMLWQSLYAGGIAVAAAVCSYIYYYLRFSKEFGGITGDTAGYFVLICEGSIAAAVFAAGGLYR